MCSLNCTKPFSLLCIAANKNCQVQLFLKFNVMEVLHYFFHSFENSCRKRKFTGLFPHRSYTLHLSLFVNNWYKWTSQISKSAILSLVQLQFISMGRNKGVSGRSPPKHSFSSSSLFKRKKRTHQNIPQKKPQLRSSKPHWEKDRSLKIRISLPPFFLTYTAVSTVPTNTHILKVNLVKTSTVIQIILHASVVKLRTA